MITADNLDEYVDVQGDCWLWQGWVSAKGYGTVYHRGRTTYIAHRAVYELLIGEIPLGMTLDHLCRVRHCVNPDHLEPVTAAENSRRSPLVRPTHCLDGHRLAGANVKSLATRPGVRVCRECERRRQREWARDHRLALRLARAS